PHFSLLQLELPVGDAAAVVLAAGLERDLFAAHAAVGDRERLAFGAERAGEHLEFLLERELALRQLVRAGDLGGHDPEQRGAPRLVAVAVAAGAEVGGLVGLPFAHGEGVGDDARAGLQVEDLRPQLEVDVRQQEHGDHGGLGEVGLEQVRLHELRALGDAFFRGVALRQLDHVGVVLDAEGARAALRRGDHGAAVARAEVHDEVVLRHLGHVEHLVDHDLRRGHPDHVLAFLADRGFVSGSGGFLGLRKSEGRRKCEDEREEGAGHAWFLQKRNGRTLCDDPRMIPLKHFAALAFVLLTSGALAQSYPSRPVTFIVPFAPGGGTDITARTVAAKLTQIWKGPSVVVENRGGAGGVIGVDVVAKARPDGHTLLIANVGSQSINPTLYPRLPYNPDSAFAPV